LGSPASGEIYGDDYRNAQKMAFPIYWVPQRVGRREGDTLVTGRGVSNLLGSPASGEIKIFGKKVDGLKFPIYWVPQRVGRNYFIANGAVSYIEFPIYWVPQRVGSAVGGVSSSPPLVSNLLGSPASGESGVCDTPSLCGCFQFIGFPSEWGVRHPDRTDGKGSVSNLLGSPASGEPQVIRFHLTHPEVSNLLGSPASGECHH